MKNLIIITILMFGFCLSANAQTVEISAETAKKAADCFTQSPLKDKVIETQDAQINALKNETKTAENLAAARQTIIDLQVRELDLFRKLRCPTTSLFFGLYKRRECF
jgi:hypothetical protein